MLVATNDVDLLISSAHLRILVLAKVVNGIDCCFFEVWEIFEEMLDTSRCKDS
jgi:hypothetical protein